MNKIDFSKISIVSHIRVDGRDRIENLVLRNTFFEKYCSNLEFVNVEDDVVRKIPRMNNEIYHLTENAGGYNKNLSYNIGFGLTNRPYVLFLDVDCVTDPNLLVKIANETNFLEEKIIYPYEYVYYLKQHIKDLFKKNINLENLILSTKKTNKDRDNTDENGRLFTGSCGGAIFTNKQNFIDVNGFNPNFTGWGYEDSEFRDRLDILGKRPIRLKHNILYHLPHGEHYTQRGKQTINAKHNKAEYDKVINMTREQCAEYTKTWKL